MVSKVNYLIVGGVVQGAKELLHGAVRAQVHAERGRRALAGQRDGGQAARGHWIIVLEHIL